MKKFKKSLIQVWRDESGQGAMEYILMATVVIVIIVAFKDKIKGVITTSVEEMGGKLSSQIGATQTK